MREPQTPELEGGKYMHLPLGELEIDHDFQRRRFKATVARRIAAAWDWDMVQVLLVSLRPDGRNVVMDGQHRVFAARLAGLPESTLMPCLGYYNRTRQQEAELAVSINGKRLGWVPMHAFWGRLEAADPDAVAIEKMLSDSGWTVRDNNNEGSFRSIVPALRIYGTPPEGPRVLARTIAAATAAWGHDPRGLGGPVLEGVARVFALYPHVRDTDMVAAMSRFSPSSLRRDAVTVSRATHVSVVVAVRDLVIGEHDRHRRISRLRSREE